MPPYWIRAILKNSYTGKQRIRRGTLYQQAIYTAQGVIRYIIRYISNKRVVIHIDRSNCNKRIAITIKELLYWIRRQTFRGSHHKSDRIRVYKSSVDKVKGGHHNSDRILVYKLKHQRVHKGEKPFQCS